MQRLTTLCKCPPGNGEELLRGLSAGLLGDRGAREGCVSSDTFVDADDPETIMLTTEVRPMS